MEKEDEILYIYFTHISQLCFEKAKEHIEKEKEPKSTVTPWNTLLNFLQQLALAEKSYIELGFLQNKHKSFLRKDNSLRSVYDSMKNDLRKLEDNCRQSLLDKKVQNYCQNITQFLIARINLIDLYEKIYSFGVNKQLRYIELQNLMETVIKRNELGFTDISLTPVRAIFSLECEILEQLFKALTELQRLQFLPSLALIHGSHTRLSAWESKIQSREIWKLGIVFKNNPLPALFQWLLKFKGTVLSKFSLYFHDTLAQQTTPNEMRHLCSKLHCDYYQKMVTFQRRNDAACVILLSDNQVNCDTTGYDSFPIIVSYPPDEIASHAGDNGRHTIYGKTQLLITLWYFGTPDCYRSVCSRFGIGKATALRTVHRVTEALLKLGPSVITWPHGESLNLIKEGFRQIGFPDTIGAVDGTYIKIPKPKEHGLSYICRKNFPSVILQGICDHSLKFTHCYAGEVGSTHDATVLRRSEIWTFINDRAHEKFPNNTHLIGDKAYPCLPQLMTPYRDNGHLTDQQKNYNFLLSRARSTIERAFCLLKKRFRCIKDLLDVQSIEWVPKYIIACCILHNICLIQNDILDVEFGLIGEDNPEQEGFRGADRERVRLGAMKRDNLCQRINAR